MPLGDSITFGVGSSMMMGTRLSGGYRVPLFELAMSAGQHLTFVGSLRNGPAEVAGVRFPRRHEGHSGYLIATDGAIPGIAALARSRVARFRPDVVLLMIGTNDVGLGVDLPNAPARLTALLDSIFEASRGVTVVLAQITPTMDDQINDLVRAYNQALPGVADGQLAAGHRVQLVDMYGAFTADPAYKTTLLFDPAHPNDSGYRVMADVWYAALGPLLR